VLLIGSAPTKQSPLRTPDADPRRLILKRITPPLSLLTALATILLIAPLPTAAQTARQELNEVQRRLGTVRGELAAARDDAERLATALAAAEATLAKAEAELDAAQAKWVKARRRSVDATEALSQATAEVLRAEQVRAGQARETYMTGGLLNNLEALLQSQSLGDFSSRVVAVQRVAENQNQTVADMRMAEVRAERARRLMDAAERDARDRRGEVAAKVRDLGAVRAVRAEAKQRLDVQVAALSRKEASLTGRSSALLARIRADEAAARRRAEAAAARRAAQESAAGAAGAARAGSLTSSGGTCDLSGVSEAEYWIIMRESGGRPTADNPVSTAFGLGQLLLANRQRYLGASYDTTDCGLQLGAFRAYVADAYGSAEAAKAFWQANGWY
jgi:colicin import membrane protein